MISFVLRVKLMINDQILSQAETNLSSDQIEKWSQEAIQLAQTLLDTAKADQTTVEYAQAQKIAGMMTDHAGKNLTIALSDQAFRSHKHGRVANQIKFLIEQYGIPQYFAWWERGALWLGNMVAQVAPSLVVPFIVAYLRRETRAVILPSETKPLNHYIQTRRESGTRLNINQLGEAILGEGEAQRRFDAYLALLARDDVEYVSVKISSIFSQINLVAFDETIEALKVRLRQLYRQAMTHPFITTDGKQVNKFVNLDMEEYRDLHLTVEAFTQVLDEDEFLNYRAGIVLQAYLPDSGLVQKQLTEWAMKRLKRGGAPIKIRIVKGANLEMERVEAAWHGWEQAPYGSKVEVDANYKRMLVYGCQPEHIQAANLGIASHNLFDLAFGLIVREHYNVAQHTEFEMLEGMANHQARAIQDKAQGLLLYAPIVKRDDFHSAIAYLVRRLDENTAEENFLHDLFGLEVDSPQWHRQKDRFLASIALLDTVSNEPRRQQNRLREVIKFTEDMPFENVADTDFSLRHNQRWAEDIRQAWADKTIDPIPLQIGGAFISDNQDGLGHDPAYPEKTAYTYVLANAEQVQNAIQIAQDAQTTWQNTPIAERKRLLIQCGEVLAKRRGEFIGAMMLDGGKRIPEADSEVSEAIDFATYYARAFDMIGDDVNNATFTPFGTIAVTPPWNFPMAIPTGGILASLMAGNTVIFKPAPEAVLVGWHIVNALWDAGIPKDVLQFVPTTDDEVGQSLITDERVNAVILTGAYQTAQLFKSWKADLRLFAETSGKNSMIITALADHDQAIKDLVKSAFGHSGQKCSASSLAVLEAEVYDNPVFLRQLKDAVESLHIGHAWQHESMVTPIIREPHPELKRALTTLETGETWLLEPRMIDAQANLWSPGIKLGVKQSSFFHQTECFGPVLGLMRANNLEHALELANDVDYGLTSGLQSLDQREIDIWLEYIEAGNAYVNRSTTGAIVQRQPFGGWKKSVFGYAKAGGKNYVLSLGEWRDFDEQSLQDAKQSYKHVWQTHFNIEHREGSVHGEDNIFRYRPVNHVVLRLERGDDALDAQKVMMATQQCGVKLTVSIALDYDADLGTITSIRENEADLLKRLNNDVDRLRVLSKPSNVVYQHTNAVHIHVVDAPVMNHGRFELRHYLHEQALSITTHRYGNILDKH